MASEELRVWLGLRLADLFVYMAGAAILALFFIHVPLVEGALAALAMLLLLAACPLGMRSSPGVSGWANAIKKVSYPLAVVGGVFFIGFCYVGYYRVPQNGMYPSLPAGSHLLALKRAYRDPSQVARGDVVVFTRAEGGKTYLYIWRVVGLPGDTIAMRGDALVINGRPLVRKKVRSDGETLIEREVNGDASYEVAFAPPDPSFLPPDVSGTLAEGQFFVLGDNRRHAWDGRYLGPISFASIIARKW